MAQRRSARITKCIVLRSGVEDPLVVVSRLLQAGGVRIQRIDSEHRRIVGRIDFPKDASPCKVTARLYPREGVSLVETLLEPPRLGGNAGAIAEYWEHLMRALKDSGLVDGEDAAWPLIRAPLR